MRQQKIHLENPNEFYDECYSVTRKNIKLLTKMRRKRFAAASVVMFDTNLWISGGQYDGSNKYLSSTEFIFLNGTKDVGPELPIALSKHVMVNLKGNLTMVIGGLSSWDLSGYYYTSEKTIRYNHTQQSWSGGPTLKNPRHYHAVGIVTDEVMQEKLVFVTGGIVRDLVNNYPTKSTELLLDNKWTQGEDSNNLHIVRV